MKTEYILPSIIILLFLMFLVLERVSPLRIRKRGFLKRFIVNISFSLLAILTAYLVVRPVSLSMLSWSMDRPFGLLNIIDLPFYAEFIIGFLLMDLSFYYWHRINHVVPLLWRFHNVHHLDPDLDASTSFRFHFIEILYSALFRVGQIMLIGMSAPTFIIYELVFQFVTIFHHSNLRLPIRLERVINYIFVTPRMHGLHHSTIKNETNSNYAVIIRWWDYLNKSLKLNVRQSDIVIGVPGYLKGTDNNLVNLLALPFQSQRQYWRSPDGSKPKREEIASSRYFMLE